MNVIVCVDRAKDLSGKNWGNQSVLYGRMRRKGTVGRDLEDSRYSETT
jgi:hypothetical protein